MLDDNFIWGYLCGRYEDRISGLLHRINRRTRGALAASFVGFSLSIIPAFFIFGSWLLALWIAIAVAVMAVVLTWLIRMVGLSRRTRGGTVRLQPNQRLKLTGRTRRDR